MPPSDLSLLGLVRHLADVEHNWFRRQMAGLDVPRLYSTVQDQDADFRGAVADPAVVDEAWRAWRAERRRPVMVHRSLVGSLERLFGHLIEVHRGAFPAWYAPAQVVVLPVSEDQAAAAEFVRRCVAAGLRAEAVVEAVGYLVDACALPRLPGS